MALKDLLEFQGFKIITAEDGQTALSIARKESPSLIILDLMLPKLDGYKVCRLLKFDKKHKNIPIIMLTARTQQEDKNMGMEMRANEYICKPYKDEELLNTIKKYLG
ncbi:MAG: response regulator [Candidatus Aureabacteria bacterium]|nr:response regulator [Candidatus Auribacterota bacterium]